ncbi:hypothetical protein MES5069_10085 [Mesorhizobium escarrei]|uniref:Uncharacterized protein n=1 Tax=Mesorhizobium escarrei TaxID=666018 RepID=A0ABN8JAZ4_9HYPH|nr:hypothetical protein MES5069_10085 [Mesorhizobium escarrei]
MTLRPRLNDCTLPDADDGRLLLGAPDRDGTLKTGRTVHSGNLSALRLAFENPGGKQ